MLHLVNKSPFSSNNLKTCFNYTKEGDKVLLYEDGVLGVMRGSSCDELINSNRVRVEIYALSEDMKARGIEEAYEGVKVIDYEGFVDLVSKDKVHSWL